MAYYYTGKILFPCITVLCRLFLYYVEYYYTVLSINLSIHYCFTVSNNSVLCGVSNNCVWQCCTVWQINIMLSIIYCAEYYSTLWSNKKMSGVLLHCVMYYSTVWEYWIDFGYYSIVWSITIIFGILQYCLEC